MKIKTVGRVGAVYDGAEFARYGVKSKKIDTSQFGTRHNSMLRYCKHDKNAIGIVVSQDGHVRVVLSVERSLVLWDNVKLLRYRSFSKQSVMDTQRWVKEHERRKKPRYGYTDTPKSLDALLRILVDEE